MIDYDSFSPATLGTFFFAFHAGAKELTLISSGDCLCLMFTPPLSWIDARRERQFRFTSNAKLRSGPR